MVVCVSSLHNRRLHSSQAPGLRGDKISQSGTSYLRTVSTDLASRHPSGAYKSAAAPRFLDNLCTPAINDLLPTVNSQIAMIIMEHTKSDHFQNDICADL